MLTPLGKCELTLTCYNLFLSMHAVTPGGCIVAKKENPVAGRWRVLLT